MPLVCKAVSPETEFQFKAGNLNFLAPDGDKMTIGNTQPITGSIIIHK